MRVDDQRQAPAALPPETRSCTHYTGDCVGRRAGLGMCGNLDRPEFDPQTVHLSYPGLLCRQEPASNDSCLHDRFNSEQSI